MAPECYGKDAEIMELKDQLATLKKEKAVWLEKESQFIGENRLISDMAEIKSNIESLTAHLKTKDGRKSQETPIAVQNKQTENPKVNIIEKNRI